MNNEQYKDFKNIRHACRNGSMQQERNYPVGTEDYFITLPTLLLCLEIFRGISTPVEFDLCRCTTYSDRIIYRDYFGGIGVYRQPLPLHWRYTDNLAPRKDIFITAQINTKVFSSAQPTNIAAK